MVLPIYTPLIKLQSLKSMCDIDLDTSVMTVAHGHKQADIKDQLPM